jgi:hypothetical protein
MVARPMVLALVAGAMVVALVATSVAAVVQTRRLAEERERSQQRATEVRELEARVAELEAAADSGGPDALGGLLDGLLGGDTGDLGGLLDGLLGGGEVGGAMAGLRGGVPGMRCLTDGGGLDGLPGGGLDGLLGGGVEGLLEEGGLDGLLGGGDDEVPSDPDALVEAISEQVAQLRELTFASDVEVAFLDDADLAAELEAILDRDLDVEELDAQTEILVALRAIPAEADLEQLNRDLLEEQVAGFYSPEDGRLVVRTPGNEVRPLDRVTLAHELEHALVDQVIGLPDLGDGTDADAALGRLAVIEGDATLVMNRWSLQHLSFQEQLGLATTGDLAGQQEQLATYPHHLQRELLFPYTDGLDLVCDRFLEGGWGAVDAAYATPPTTTAGVLFPDRYDETPVDTPALTTPSGASLRHEDTFGAAPLAWLFEAPGGDDSRALDDPLGRAAAWAGGDVRLWDLDGTAVVGMALAEGDGGDPGLCGSVTAWYAAADPQADEQRDGDRTRFTGDDRTAVVACDDDGVRVGIADDPDAAATVAG